MRTGHGFLALALAPAFAILNGICAAGAVYFLAVVPAAAWSQDVKGYVQSSASMMPSLAIGDWVLVVSSAPPAVGDVVLYVPPGPARRTGTLPVVKRIVARGGDRVSMYNGELRVNGQPLAHADCVPSEPPVKLESADVAVECTVERAVSGKEYRVIRARNGPPVDFDEVKVPTGHFFMLGDFRDHSIDSRQQGPIPASSVVGVAKQIYNSPAPSRIGRNL